MKYFTPDWLGDGDTDLPALPPEVEAERWRAVLDAYWKHVAGLVPSVPPELHDLVLGKISLHDGLVLEAGLDAAARELRLVMNCGNCQDGYFDLELRYGALRRPYPSPAGLNELISSKAQAREQEFDRDGEGLLVHRILFWIGRDEPAGPYRELEMVFETLRVTQTPAQAAD